MATFDLKKDQFVKDLTALLNGPDTDKILIVSHTYPDVDAIASQYGLSYILKNKFDKEVQIAYSKNVNHESAEYLQKLLIETYKTRPPDISDISLKKYDLIFLVDTNPSLNTSPFTKKQLDQYHNKMIILDHHSKKGKFDHEYRLEEVLENNEVGSLSTRITEYFESLEIKLDSKKEEDSLLATALMAGIEIDTGEPQPKTVRDYLAIAFLREYINKDIYVSIVNRPNSEQGLTAIGRGLYQRVKINNVVVGCGGYLNAGNRGTIAKLTDLLLNEEGIDIAIGCAIMNKKLELAIRTDDKSRIAAETIASWFGGGGRNNKGGSSKDMGFLAEFETNDEKVLDICVQYITQVIKRQFGKS